MKTTFNHSLKAAKGSKVYIKISGKMNEVGYQKSLDQCRDKEKKLKNTLEKLRISTQDWGRDSNVTLLKARM